MFLLKIIFLVIFFYVLSSFWYYCSLYFIYRIAKKENKYLNFKNFIYYFDNLSLDERFKPQYKMIFKSLRKFVDSFWGEYVFYFPFCTPCEDLYYIDVLKENGNIGRVYIRYDEEDEDEMNAYLYYYINSYKEKYLDLGFLFPIFLLVSIFYWIFSFFSNIPTLIAFIFKLAFNDKDEIVLESSILNGNDVDIISVVKKEDDKIEITPKERVRLVKKDGNIIYLEFGNFYTLPIKEMEQL